MSWDGVERRSPAARRAADLRAVPWQVTITAHEVLDAILRDDGVDLDGLGPLLARLAEVTGDGAEGRWTAERVLARCRELDDLYNPPELACRVCGCTDQEACAGGCSWVSDPEGLGPLCSSCLPMVAELLGVPA